MQESLCNIKLIIMKKCLLKVALVFILLIPLSVNAQDLIPTTAISNIPAVSIRDLNLSRNDYTILKTITATAIVYSDNSKKSRKIYEENEEFTLVYDIIKENGKMYLDYKSCDGVVRLGYIGSTDIYNSDSNYIPAEEIVRRLALYRLINLAKEYGADVLFEPTITTTATATGKTLIYKTEASAKLIKIINK